MFRRLRGRQQKDESEGQPAPSTAPPPLARGNDSAGTDGWADAAPHGPHKGRELCSAPLTSNGSDALGGGGGERQRMCAYDVGDGMRSNSSSREGAEEEEEECCCGVAGGCGGASACEAEDEEEARGRHAHSGRQQEHLCVSAHCCPHSLQQEHDDDDVNYESAGSGEEGCRCGTAGHLYEYPYCLHGGARGAEECGEEGENRSDTEGSAAFDTSERCRRSGGGGGVGVGYAGVRNMTPLCEQCNCHACRHRAQYHMGAINSCSVSDADVDTADADDDGSLYGYERDPRRLPPHRCGHTGAGTQRGSTDYDGEEELSDYGVAHPHHSCRHAEPVDEEDAGEREGSSSDGAYSDAGDDYHIRCRYDDTLHYVDGGSTEGEDEEGGEEAGDTPFHRHPYHRSSSASEERYSGSDYGAEASEDGGGGGGGGAPAVTYVTSLDELSAEERRIVAEVQRRRRWRRRWLRCKRLLRWLWHLGEGGDSGGSGGGSPPTHMSGTWRAWYEELLQHDADFAAMQAAAREDARRRRRLREEAEERELAATEVVLTHGDGTVTHYQLQ